MWEKLRSPVAWLMPLLSLFVCLWFGYGYVDIAISMDHLQQSLKSATGASRKLSLLLSSEWRGKTEAEVMKVLEDVKRKNPSEIDVLKKQGDNIFLDEICLEFSDGRFQGICRE